MLNKQTVSSFPARKNNFVSKTFFDYCYGTIILADLKLVVTVLEMPPTVKIKGHF